MKLIVITFFILCFSNSFASNFRYLNIQNKQQQEFKLNSDINVIVFLSDKCPCTDSHLMHLNDLATQYKNINFIGVHSNFIPDMVSTSSYYKKSNIKFPILMDQKFSLANKFRAKKTPHVFIVSSKEKVLYSGGITNSILFKNAKKFHLRDSLENLNNNKAIQKKYTRTLGCAIDRSKT